MSKKRRRNLGGVFILILLFIIAVTVVLTIPVFNITSVTVTGNARLTTEELLTVAAVPTGKNIYQISMKDVEERLLAQPYVLSATVKRRFPAKVAITVTEREEAAAIRCTGGYAIIDSEGRVLRIAAEPESVMTVSGGTVDTAQPGSTILMTDENFLGNFKLLLSELKGADLSVTIRHMRLESSINTVLETEHNLEIHLGGMDELSYKLQMCKNIMCGGYEGINRESSGVLKWTGEGQFSYRHHEN
ncbi:MAG: FtsQ-type POTRA domain-containing protein [Ruminococcaceae bacterium]|nr:FtsQ-type POTRA domain-containing protein [Oscillospiraceae bacterium]